MSTPFFNQSYQTQPWLIDLTQTAQRSTIDSAFMPQSNQPLDGLHSTVEILDESNESRKQTIEPIFNTGLFGQLPTPTTSTTSTSSISHNSIEPLNPSNHLYHFQPVCSSNRPVASGRRATVSFPSTSPNKSSLRKCQFNSSYATLGLIEPQHLINSSQTLDITQTLLPNQAPNLDVAHQSTSQDSEFDTSTTEDTFVPPEEALQSLEVQQQLFSSTINDMTGHPNNLVSLCSHVSSLKCPSKERSDTHCNCISSQANPSSHDGSMRAGSTPIQTLVSRNSPFRVKKPGSSTLPHRSHPPKAVSFSFSPSVLAHSVNSRETPTLAVTSDIYHSSDSNFMNTDQKTYAFPPQQIQANADSPSAVHILSHPDLRQESDPPPVAPLPQRPWEHRPHYSVSATSTSVPSLQAPSPSLEREPLASTHEGFSNSFGMPWKPISSSITTSIATSSVPTTASSMGFGQDPSVMWTDLAIQRHSKPQITFSGSIPMIEESGAELRNSLPQNHASQRVPPPHYYPTASLPVTKSKFHNGAGKMQGGFGQQQLASITEQLDFDCKQRKAVFPKVSLENLIRPGETAYNSLQRTLPQLQSPFPIGFPTDPSHLISRYASCIPVNARPDVPYFPHHNAFLRSQFRQSPLDSDGLSQLNSQCPSSKPPKKLNGLSVIKRPLWSDKSCREVVEQEPVMLSKSPEENSKEILEEKKSTCQELLDSSKRKRHIQGKQYQPSHENFLEDCSGSSNRLPGEHDKKSQKVINSPSSRHEEKENRECEESKETGDNQSKYIMRRFGGLGQGNSPYPPGLNEKVKPSKEDFLGVTDKNGEVITPWKQDLRCDEDLYTPIWCRGENDQKEGFCDMCEGGAWFRLKNSAYWYHKQYFHGVSSTTGHYFYPPKATKKGVSTSNRQQILGLCHECGDWVGYSSVIGNGPTKKSSKDDGSDKEPKKTYLEINSTINYDNMMASKIPTLWYKHAHKCHRHQTCKGAKGRKKAKKR
ncbi:hypothetical protein O181_059520 [Austropuccinia psidii MF-1]|uniref:Transcription regulator Rua1 C-terminal domain-containing protein n=1 Tax=Austropuccinia psidii MF-1 TaxID=1389203 RepID=A0A9Q3HYT4_9BASI|nr:hypothetical protein [Austropuccinia psidii MF-1]